MNLFKTKKFKYGALAVCFAVAVIALIIVANSVISALSLKYGWFFDMTANTIITVSDETKTLLDSIDGDNKVTVYFLADSERLNSSAAAGYNTSYAMWGMKNIHSLSLELAERYDFINVEYIDITSEPEKIKEIYGEKYKEYYDTNTFSLINVIVKNETYMRDASGNYIVDTITGERTPEIFVKTYTRSDFYTGSSLGYLNGFCGDFKLCSAVLSVCCQNGKAYFLTGHGEPVGASENDFGGAAALALFLSDAGYDVSKIDLSRENIDPSENTLVVIYAPKTDITSGDMYTGSVVSEKEKLEKLLSDSRISLAVVLGEGKLVLSNLESLLADYGIGVETAKMKDSGAASLSTDGYTLAGDIKNTKIAERIKAINAKAVFSSAKALTVDASKGAYSIVSAPASASPDGKVTYEDGTEVSFLAASEKENAGRVLVCSSAPFVSVFNIYNSVYSNRDILLSFLAETGKEGLALNVSMKLLDDGTLDITRSEAVLWTVIVSLVIPLVFAIIGTAVYLRRRHS